MALPMKKDKIDQGITDLLKYGEEHNLTPRHWFCVLEGIRLTILETFLNEAKDITSKEVH